MTPIFRSLLLVIAGATQRELARKIRYLKVENEVLRSKLPERLTVTHKERQRLLKFGAKLGKALRQLVTIVTSGTFLRWIREAKGSRRADRVRLRGRPRTPEQVRRLILKLARENSWGVQANCRRIEEARRPPDERLQCPQYPESRWFRPVPSGPRRPGTSFSRNMPIASGSATSSVS